MCGRYSLLVEPATIGERFSVRVPEAISQSSNCAPSESLPVITAEHDEQVTVLEWGLVPHWADDDTTQHINARSETVTDKPSFQQAAATQRCIVPATGYYEWDKTGQPHLLTLPDADQSLFAFAGIYDRWKGAQTQLGGFGAADPPRQRYKETFAILTRPATDAVAHIHDRMPVILPVGDERSWLETGDVAQYLRTHDAPEAVEITPVSELINDPRTERQTAPDDT